MKLGLETVETPFGELYYYCKTSVKGDLYEYWVTAEGIIIWCRHHSFHGNPKTHPLNPHDHRWITDDKGNNRPDDNDKGGKPPDYGFHAPENDNDEIAQHDNSFAPYAKAGAYLAAGVGVYEVFKWVIAIFLIPETSGASLIVAGATP